MKNQRVDRYSLLGSHLAVSRTREGFNRVWVEGGGASRAQWARGGAREQPVAPLAPQGLHVSSRPPATYITPAR